jgi:hypothetical protein
MKVSILRALTRTLRRQEQAAYRLKGRYRMPRASIYAATLVNLLEFRAPFRPFSVEATSEES